MEIMHTIPQLHKTGKVLRRVPNLINGFNLFVIPEKLRLIDAVYREFLPSASSFADLGGVWNVNAAYARYSLRQKNVRRGVIVDTDYPVGVLKTLSRYPRLERLHGDFTDPSIIRRIRSVDVVYMFDVLLHQANPDWDRVLSLYADVGRCFAIYNQQFVGGKKTVRLTDLPVDEYRRIVPAHRDGLDAFAMTHPDRMQEDIHKRVKDTPHIWQWGITDADLRNVMDGLGFREVWFRNYGQFSSFSNFENHAFIFLRK
jgi:hypothetical protein